MKLPTTATLLYLLQLVSGNEVDEINKMRPHPNSYMAWAKTTGFPIDDPDVDHTEEYKRGLILDWGPTSTLANKCEDKESADFCKELSESGNGCRTIQKTKCNASCKLCDPNAEPKTVYIGRVQINEQIEVEDMKKANVMRKDYHQYLKEEVGVLDVYADVVEKCINHNRYCLERAYGGQCHAEFDYMLENCPLACKFCSQLPGYRGVDPNTIRRMMNQNNSEL